MKNFIVKTKLHKFKVNYDSDFIKKEKIEIKKELFESLCKKGCINYNNKYSCPPFSPNFKNLIQDKEGLFVVIFLVNLKEIPSTEYNKVRIANVVMKSRIEKFMRSIEKDSNFLSTGACRLCKPCQGKKKLPCKHPEKRRYSLESVGINCNKLTKDLFGIKLFWYKNKASPEYTSIVCGLPCNKKDANYLSKELEKFLIFT